MPQNRLRMTCARAERLYFLDLTDSPPRLRVAPQPSPWPVKAAPPLAAAPPPAPQPPAPPKAQARRQNREAKARGDRRRL